MRALLFIGRFSTGSVILRIMRSQCSILYRYVSRNRHTLSYTTYLRSICPPSVGHGNANTGRRVGAHHRMTQVNVKHMPSACVASVRLRVGRAVLISPAVFKV